MSIFKESLNKSRLPVALSLDTDKYQASNIICDIHNQIQCLKLSPAFLDIKSIRLPTFTLPVLIDAKLGDVPSTMKAYKNTYFKDTEGYAVTLNPYCGYESLKVFTEDKSIFSFIWTLSSDLTANTWQQPVVDELLQSDLFKDTENVGMVVPSTNIGYIKQIRDKFPNTLLLIPGIGFQNGSIKEVKNAIGTDNILFVIGRRLINSSDIVEELKIIEKEIRG